MALGGASAKTSPAAGMKRKSADEPTKKGKAKKDESSEESRCGLFPYALNT
jgi:ribosomal protein L12E/L44/L45/RPP1/RPP2